MNIFFNDTYNILSTIIFSIPLLWGVYEFREFRFQIEDIKKKAENIEQKFDDISKNKLDNYPLLIDVKEVVDKVNKVFKP